MKNKWLPIVWYSVVLLRVASYGIVSCEAKGTMLLTRLLLAMVFGYKQVRF